jgi:uncharacterized protein (DUF362 family)
MTMNRNRRLFLKAASAGALGAWLPGDGLFRTPPADGAAEKVRVAVVRNEKAISTRNVVDRRQTALMIDAALQAITGKRNIHDAWTVLGVTRDDVIGIKVNCNTWTILLDTHPELVYALCDSLSTVLPPNSIIIYERFTGELERSRYRINKGTQGVRCFGNDEGGGFRGDITRIVTDACTKIINMPTLKAVEGEFAGSLFLKNHIGSIPLGAMTECHGNADYCTEVCNREALRSKAFLALCDGLRGTFKRGVPWYYGGIIMSRDQIAAECAALSIVNEKRAQEKEHPLAIPGYVKHAGSLGLGVADPGRIEVIPSVL